MKFIPWLLLQVERDDDIGDLARDAARDLRKRCLPKSGTTPSALLNHVLDVHGADERSELIERATATWKAESRRSGARR